MLSLLIIPEHILKEVILIFNSKDGQFANKFRKSQIRKFADLNLSDLGPSTIVAIRRFLFCDLRIYTLRTPLFFADLKFRQIHNFYPYIYKLKIQIYGRLLAFVKVL